MIEIPVYLEIGKKRTFAGALDWPGWSRSGRDEASAVAALFQYGPRFAGAIEPARLGFFMPDDISALVIVERLEGNAATDFGAPNIPPAQDLTPVNDFDAQRLQALLACAWEALDAAQATAAGRELSRGPRGGGRDLDKIVRHVYDAGRAYLGQLGWKSQSIENGDLSRMIAHIRDENRLGLVEALSGSLPEYGPRGGRRWTARTFVRRSVWHILDHVWEVEDRMLNPSAE